MHLLRRHLRPHERPSGAGMHRHLSSAWRDGAYYTQLRNGGGWLAVLPGERLVVYSWRD